MIIRNLVAVVAFSALAAACGGSSPEAQSPDTAANAEKPAEGTEAAPATPAAEAAPAEATKAPEAAPTEATPAPADEKKAPETK